MTVQNDRSRHRRLPRIHLIIIAVGLIFGFYRTALGENAVWIETFGEAVLVENRTLQAVKAEAISKARRAAIEKVVGVQIQSSTLSNNYDVVTDFIAATSAGKILAENVLGWEIEKITSKNDTLPVLRYKVRLNVKVAKEEGLPDPAFKLKTALNKRVFIEGDPVRISLTATQDCYVHIFLISAHNEVYIIFPNRYRTNHFLEENTPFVYPSDADIQRGYKLLAGLLPGIGRARETLQILVTKKPIRFTPDLLTAGVDLISFSQKSASLHQLIAELVSIPLNERVESYIAYEIMKNE